MNDSATQEFFDQVDEYDRVTGRISRSQAHGNPAVIHRVVHVLVFNGAEELYLQKRADDKDVQPGKWDTSVGGHVNAGEVYLEAAYRELSEELGIPEGRPGESGPELHFLHRYLHRNSYESEYVSTYLCRWDGGITIQTSEISQGRFWKLSEIDLLCGSARQQHPHSLPTFSTN